MIYVLGVSGSPVKGGNTDAFLNEALNAAASPDVAASFVSLAAKDIRDCTQCNWCVTKQVEGKYCSQDDHMTPLYPQLVRADVIFLATPASFARLSPMLACFIDRLRCFYLGRKYSGALADKVGGAMVVSWYRNRGVEPALQSIVSAFLGLQMLPVSPPRIGSPYGAAAVSSSHGEGEFDRADHLGILKDKHGLEGARTMAQRAVAVARLLKKE